MDIVFGKKWFAKHQSALLFLLNNIIFRDWFRGILDIQTDKRVMNITPYEVTWCEEKKVFTTEFHIARKYGYRLYLNFEKVWNMCHQFDMRFANKFMPQFNLGFDTLIAYPDASPEVSTVDGRVNYYSSNQSFATIHDAASGSQADDSGATDSSSSVYVGASSGQLSGIYRSLFLFDTSSITNLHDVQAAIVSMNKFANTNNGQLAQLAGEAIFSTNPLSNTAVQMGDYSRFGSTPFSATLKYADISGATRYYDYTLNSSGLAAILRTGITKLGIREATMDGANAQMVTFLTNCSFSQDQYFAEDTTAANGKDPKLTVTHAQSGDRTTFARQSMII